MRRRSRLEVRQQEDGRPHSLLRCLSCTGLVFLSLALPAALTLRGTSSRSYVRKGNESNSGGVDSSQKPSAAWDGSSSSTGPVSPMRWRGISPGIPSSPRSIDDIHIVFSTDCSPYQGFQSIVLFNTAEVVEQKGPVTRVASGCTEEEQKKLRLLMSKQPERFRVHFTPDFSKDPETGEEFKFYNKPNGIAHFLEHADPPVKEAVIALVDPDMVLMSKLTPQVGNPKLMLWHDAEFEQPSEWVTKGHPVGQFYGLGGSWSNWKDFDEIVEDLGPDTPANEITLNEAAKAYPVGPPYLMHPHDWARLADIWASLSVKVYRRHPGILAEMYGFCVAAAHLRLPHRVARGLMVSDTNPAAKEGWPLVDAMSESACDPSAVDKFRPELPPVVHYCQFYRVGTYMFGKRHRSNHDFFSCDADAYELPPPDYLSSPMVELRVQPVKAGEASKEDHVLAITGVRQGYAMCAVLRAMNVAQVSYKNRYCRAEEISGGVKRLTDLNPEQVAADSYA